MASTLVGIIGFICFINEIIGINDRANLPFKLPILPILAEESVARMGNRQADSFQGIVDQSICKCVATEVLIGT
ncbi:MAG: hypothetical protein ACFBSF_17600 [Leptolyngbyaceae cyanobacterium]